MIIKHLFSNIGSAFRQNLIPGFILQIIAIMLGAAYYFLPWAMPAFLFVAGLKSQYGILYAMVSTALFGGLIPYCILYITGQITHSPFRQYLFYMLFWAIKGAEVDLFYRFQGMVFGTGNSWQIVTVKTAFDQLVYAALWMVPTIALAYLWKECDFNLKRWQQKLDSVFFSLTLPTIIISNWLVWIPAIVVVYSMPPDLQVPLYNLVQCFFVLLLAVLAKEKRPSPSSNP